MKIRKLIFGYKLWEIKKRPKKQEVIEALFDTVSIMISSLWEVWLSTQEATKAFNEFSHAVKQWQESKA